ncbi:hypothetical protein F2P81_017267 [Scophthalmus maximus]|uniref:Uncharacterized protein n=1 Tax=Scophthalmus maximus TaxID=52904 RepID=A0A6A4S5P3_SCOMX|nr:hypothetical protein F2P81_017267 [Scophthalmus maximus]
MIHVSPNLKQLLNFKKLKKKSYFENRSEMLSKEQQQPMDSQVRETQTKCRPSVHALLFHYGIYMDLHLHLQQHLSDLITPCKPSHNLQTPVTRLSPRRNQPVRNVFLSSSVPA